MIDPLVWPQMDTMVSVGCFSSFVKHLHLGILEAGFFDCGNLHR